MKKIAVIIVVAVFALIGVSTITALRKTNNNSDQTQNVIDETNTSGEDLQIENVIIPISGLEYTLPKVTVKAGSTVAWLNQDTQQHDVTPDKNGSFDGSKLLNKGDSYSYTFNDPGTYDYHCSPHPHMTGTVVVVP